MTFESVLQLRAGNFGLKDQELALRWIKEHISSFGGDPDRITVFGESSGASSIGFHQLSATGSSSTFTRSIYQSGSPDSNWAFMSQSDARQRSDSFFAAVNCSSTLDAEALLGCLRQLDAFYIRDNEWVTSEFVVTCFLRVHVRLPIWDWLIYGQLPTPNKYRVSQKTGLFLEVCNSRIC